MFCAGSVTDFISLNQSGHSLFSFLKMFWPADPPGLGLTTQVLLLQPWPSMDQFMDLALYTGTLPFWNGLGSFLYIKKKILLHITTLNLVLITFYETLTYSCDDSDTHNQTYTVKHTHTHTYTV